jgi:hypothetical protein
MDRIAADYGDRFRSKWQARAVRSLAGAYNLVAASGERLLSRAVPCRAWDAAAAPAPLRDKGAAITSYFPIFRCGDDLAVVDAGGTGRILNSFGDGWGDLSEHACAWRELRQRGAKLCEVLAGSAKAKRRMSRLGYVPVRMPVWYVDRNGMGGKLIAALARNEISFFHTDKSI